MGFNYRLSDLQAAIGIAQVERLDELLNARDNVAALYRERLAQLGAAPAGEDENHDIVLPCENNGDERRGWFVFVVQLPKATDRDAVISWLRDHGIASKAYLPSIRLLPAYRERFGFVVGIADRGARLRALPGAAVLHLDDRGTGRSDLHGARRGARQATLDSGPVSRFGEEQDPLFRRIRSSIRSTGGLAPFDIAQSKAHALILGKLDVLDAVELEQITGGLDSVAEELDQGTFEFRDDEDIHMAIERRLTELIGPVGGKLSRHAQKRPGRDGPGAAGRGQSSARDCATGVADGDARGAGRDPATGRRPGTPTCSERSLSTSAITCSPTSGCSSATPGASSGWRRRPPRCRRAPAPSRESTGTSTATPWRPTSASRGRIRTRSTRCRTATSPSTTSPRPRSARCTSATRRGDRALVDQGVRLRRAAGFVRLRLEHHAPEEEPGRGRAAPGGAAGRRVAPEPAGHDARAASRLQQGPAGGQGAPIRAIDNLELCLAAATGMLGGITFNEERLAAAAEDEMLAATDLADALVKEGVPFGEAPGSLAGWFGPRSIPASRSRS